MVYLNRHVRTVCGGLTVASLGLSVIAAIRADLPLALLTVLSFYAVTAVDPRARRHENVYIFFLAATVGAPLTAAGAVRVGALLGEPEFAVMGVLRFIVAYVLTFSVGEVALGVLTRFLFPNQWSIRK